MKWVKLIVSIVAGFLLFFVLFNNVGSSLFDFSGSSKLYDSDTKSVSFFVQVLYFIYLVVILFLGTTVTVVITEKFKLGAAIVTGVISGIVGLFFFAMTFLAIGDIFKGLPIIGGIIGWVAFKYSGVIIQKIRSRSKDLTSEFDD